MPLQSIESSVAEVERCVGKGFKSMFLPTKPPVMHGHWNAEEWEPLWDVLEGPARCSRSTSAPSRARSRQKFRGPGGAMINYVNTTFGGQQRGADDDRVAARWNVTRT